MKDKGREVDAGQILDTAALIKALAEKDRNK
jgi:hypothetical protein